MILIDAHCHLEPKDFAEPAEVIGSADPPARVPLPQSDQPTEQLPIITETTAELPAVRKRPPRRRYFCELRKARDHGMDLFDRAVEDQAWEQDHDR